MNDDEVAELKKHISEAHEMGLTNIQHLQGLLEMIKSLKENQAVLIRMIDALQSQLAEVKDYISMK